MPLLEYQVSEVLNPPSSKQKVEATCTSKFIDPKEADLERQPEASTDAMMKYTFGSGCSFANCTFNFYMFTQAYRLTMIRLMMIRRTIAFTLLIEITKSHAHVTLDNSSGILGHLQTSCKVPCHEPILHSYL
jgi:hypothetical protein